jgi:hypothetical protein
VVEGSPDDIVLLYNASSTAPSVWKNVKGDIAFQNDTASICYAFAISDIAMVRYIEHIVRDLGAKTLIPGLSPCNLVKASASIDLIVFQRGGLRKQPAGYVSVLDDLIEGSIFREYRTVTDYSLVSQKREQFSRQIASELSSGARLGYGVVAVSESPTACLLPATPGDRLDGIKDLLNRNRDVIAPNLNSDWQFIFQATTDLAFRDLQRRQCGYVAGEASALSSLVQALRREQLNFVFSPVWWNDKDVDQAAFDARDAKEQEIRKQAAIDRAQKAQHDLDEDRRKKKGLDKVEIETQLRQKGGARARGLENWIHEIIKDLANKRVTDTDRHFTKYSNWLNLRFSDQWETFNVTSDVADFGTVQWEGRPLDVIIVRSIIQQKNRFRGKYEDGCYFFGFVDDPEFMVKRDFFAEECSSAVTFVNNWKIGKSFKSQWNAN